MREEVRKDRSAASKDFSYVERGENQQLGPGEVQDAAEKEAPGGGDQQATPDKKKNPRNYKTQQSGEIYRLV